MSNFNGKVAVVTGGNSGMGLATAKELAAGGAKVVIAGRDQKTLDEAVKKIGNNSFGVKTDVSKLSEIENLFADASKKFGKIDILFVNAGIGKFAPVEQSDEALFDEIVDTNFKGAYFTVKYALPFLNDGASIIFTTSASAKIGRAGASEAFYQSFAGKKWFAGGFVWKWYVDDDHHGGNKIDFTPQNKAAEKVIEKWYSN